LLYTCRNIYLSRGPRGQEFTVYLQFLRERRCLFIQKLSRFSHLRDRGIDKDGGCCVEIVEANKMLVKNKTAEWQFHTEHTSPLLFMHLNTKIRGNSKRVLFRPHSHNIHTNTEINKACKS
jgi:hypothetical protein